MSYSGEVEVGGSADTREAGDLVITKVAVGPMSNNAYLLRCAITGEQALIDAADEPDTLLELVGDAGLARVVTTHRHPDHWQALADRRRRDRRRDGREPGRRRGDPRPHDPPRHRRRPRPRRLVRARGHRPRRPHPRLDRPRLRRPRRHRPPVHRRLAVPWRRRQDHRSPRTSPPSSTTSRPSSSTASTTTPGSTPATGTTRHSAPSGARSLSGRPHGGEKTASTQGATVAPSTRNEPSRRLVRHDVSTTTRSGFSTTSRSDVDAHAIVPSVAGSPGFVRGDWVSDERHQNGSRSFSWSPKATREVCARTCRRTRKGRKAWDWSLTRSAHVSRCQRLNRLRSGVSKTDHRGLRALSTTSRRAFNRFDDGTWVYPGHGNDSTLGSERPSIPEWRERGW